MIAVRDERAVDGGTTAAEEPAAERAAFRQAIDPGDRVGPIAARLRGAEEAVEVAQAFGLDDEVGRGDPRELQIDPDDDAGQPEAADRRAEKLGTVSGADLDGGAVAPEQSEPQDVAAEGAGAVMVLAVDVVRDRAPERHEFGAGRHRHEPAARYGERQQRPDRQARLGPHHAARPVGRDQPVEPSGADEMAAAVEADVAVGAPEAMGENRRVRGRRARRSRRPRRD